MATITRLTMVKFLELILVFVLLILDWNSFNHGNELHHLIVLGTFGGYLIILIGLFVGGLTGTPVNRRVDLFFSVVGCILFLIAGILTINLFQGTVDIPFVSSNKGLGITKGSFAIIESLLMLIDAVLTFRGEA